MRRYGLSLISERLEPTGIGTYGLALARALAPLLAEDERLVVIRHPDFPKPLAHERVEDAPVRFPASRMAFRRLAEQVALPRAAARAGLTLVHSINYAVPLLWHGPRVLTLMDVRLLLSRERADLGRRFFRSFVFPMCIRRAARVVAISAWTARNGIEALGIDPSRVAVIPLGVDRAAIERVTAEDRARVRSRLGLEGPSVVFAGELEPHKNVPRLVEAYHAIEAQPDARGAELVIAGSGGGERARVLELVRALGLERRVRFTGYLAREDLLALIAGAALLALPSLEEGFGLTVLEAFAAGTPVLTSDRGAIPEVAADAALVVDPTDAGAIARGMLKLLSDDGLRAELSARGRARASDFGWERTARATLDVYRSVASAALDEAEPLG